MKRFVRRTVLLALLITALSMLAGGCSKKPAPLPPPPAAKAEPPAPPPPAAPTISFSASPATIEKGRSATLRWSATNASNVTIDGGIGTVEASGSRSVSPGASTTYHARATGAGGSATGEARVTVVEPPPPPAPPPTRSLTDAEIFSRDVKDIFFDYDKYDIRDDARPVLVTNAGVLKDRGGVRVLIEGHCDERGSEKYNLALGDRRANATKEFLVNQGISTDRLEAVSLGEERPFAEGHDEAAWAQNRRAHFVMK